MKRLTEENGSGCAGRSASSASGEVSTAAASASDSGAELPSSNPSHRAYQHSKDQVCGGQQQM